MKQRHINLLDQFFTQELGENWKSSETNTLSPNKAIELLWSLNNIYTPYYHLISSLPYSAAHEREANTALEHFVFGKELTERDPKPIVWRVLLERQTQSILVATANMAQNITSFITIPDGLSFHAQSKAVALLLQWDMKLILLPQKHNPDSWPPQAPDSLMKH